jgi:hypothetical protein
MDCCLCMAHGAAHHCSQLPSTSSDYLSQVRACQARVHFLRITRSHLSVEARANSPIEEVGFVTLPSPHKQVKFSAPVRCFILDCLGLSEGRIVSPRLAAQSPETVVEARLGSGSLHPIGSGLQQGSTSCLTVQSRRLQCDHL